MREACVLARDMLDLCCAMAQPGVTTDAIDAAVHAAIVEAGACPSPLNYHGFPKVRYRMSVGVTAIMMLVPVGGSGGGSRVFLRVPWSLGVSCCLSSSLRVLRCCCPPLFLRFAHARVVRHEGTSCARTASCVGGAQGRKTASQL